MANFFDVTKEASSTDSFLPAQTLDLDALAAIPTVVEKVNIDGVGRTKDVVLQRECQRIFAAATFEELVLSIDHTIREFQRLGLFSAVGALIDVGRGGPQQHNYEVSFFVKEPSRILGSLQTTVSGSGDTGLNVAVEMPNTFGAGQRIRVEEGFGTKTKSHFSLSFTQPIQLSPLQHITGALFRRNFVLDASGLFNIDHGVSVDLHTQLSPWIRHRLGWEGAWRFVNSASPLTPYDVRQYTGHTLKSAVINEVARDTRDHPMLPESGTLVRGSCEVAGVGGDVRHVKPEARLEVNVPLVAGISVQGTFGWGYVAPVTARPVNIADRYFLGGLNFRGFAHNHVGPHSGNYALGGNMYWTSGAHVYAPLPFGDPYHPFLRHIRLHGFFNTGNVGSVGGSQHHHWRTLFSDFPASVGGGIAVALGKFARLEINWARVLRANDSEIQAGRLSFGLGVNYS
ncbi:sorting and assembly machinery component 50 homolog B-like isoform X2 [Paramacrobiotus metropolitanus]|uniref:sorting and assembly machinery component 50 homolog B-like isoform X2 n=1 Tax=Paramacrobiotus metropolitanus TaxID=2943436 RepID=UPI002445606C|nr:sorting and assembly machinery component 50 homolog B-like isoform X2 [Paramacrobiotus metropolitanus]